MQDELLNVETVYCLKEAQFVVIAWRKLYNTKRPHRAVGYRSPAPQIIIPMEPAPVMH